MLPPFLHKLIKNSALMLPPFLHKLLKFIVK
jgi:hypothetical protein